MEQIASLFGFMNRARPVLRESLCSPFGRHRTRRLEATK
jgi:hypothetical protein